jgi:hypothetical protein
VPAVITSPATGAHAGQSAPVSAALPGLRAKIWLANQQADTYGGSYAWDDVAAMRADQGGKIFQRLQPNPHMIDVTVRDFPVLGRAHEGNPRRVLTDD